MRLSLNSQRRLDEFAEAAQHWGWEQDQGSGARVRDAEEEYDSTKARLTARLLYLERRIQQLTSQPATSAGIDQ